MYAQAEPVGLPALTADAAWRRARAVSDTLIA